MSRGTSLTVWLALAVGVLGTLWFCLGTLAATDHAAALRALGGF